MATLKNLSIKDTDSLVVRKIKEKLNATEGKAKKGNAQSGAGFVICAILDWAGICRNEKRLLSIEPMVLEE